MRMKTKHPTPAVVMSQEGDGNDDKHAPGALSPENRHAASDFCTKLDAQDAQCAK